MDFSELCKARYSLRKFSSQPVEKEKLDLILEAAHNAPTAANYQPQHIFVMESLEARAKLESCVGPYFHPPVALVVTYDPKVAWVRQSDGKNHGEIDASLVAGQIMLQAADLGLGTTFMGKFDYEKIWEAFPEMQGFIPIAVIPLGYPAEGAHPARLHTDKKPIEEMVTYYM